MVRAATTVALGLGLAIMPACYTGLGDADLNGFDSQGPGAADAGNDAGGDDGQVEEPEALCLEGGVGDQPLRRLTRSQYDHVVRDLLGVDSGPAAVFPADEKLGAFYSNGVAPVSDLLVEQYMNVAEELSITAVEDLSGLLPCDPSTMGEDACADEFIDTFGRRALRRPLEEPERQMLHDLYVSGRDTDGFSDGIRLVVQALLQSPYFLYHVELGEAGEPGDLTAPLTQYEVASRLSFFLWDSMPDDDLLDAAQAGELATPEQLREHAERMLDDPRATDAIGSFHLQWLGVDDLMGVEKDAEAFPGFDEALKQAMMNETADFANWVIQEGDGRLETLMTSSTSVIDGPLFELYGVQPPADFTPGDLVELPADERAGLFTHASVLARNSHVDQTSPVHRGVMVRENFLCQGLPTPPDDVDDTPPQLDPDATTRERFEQHTEDPSCASCHTLIDPIGFGLSAYDGLGAFVTTEAGVDVDERGELTGTGSGRLFAFVGVAPAKLVEFDKATGTVVDIIELTGLELTDAFAFAFWGGDFYFFTEANDTLPGFPEGTSRVVKLDYDGSDGGGPTLTTVVESGPILVVGAGVSTCAPITPEG